ncbi:MAG: penicillin-binding protein 2 [Patescibacteria group bacterium]
MKHRMITRKIYTDHPMRIRILWGGIFLFGLIIIGRLFWLQILHHRDYLELASQQHDIYQELLPDRGIIYTQDTRVQDKDNPKLFPVATNRDFYLIYGQTYAIDDPGATTERLNSVLALPQAVADRIQTQLAKYNDPYEPLAHRVTEEKIQKVAELNLAGIKWVKEKSRYYPENNIGSHVLGFVGFVDDKLVGQYGLEGYYNSQISGQAGFVKSERDASGSLIGVGEHDYASPENGSSLVLTIDDTVQTVLCQKLDEAVERYKAEGASVVVMDPKTGAILAMCGWPNFDPNDYGNVENIKYYNNPTVFAAYEPGSVFKPITMSIALDQGKVTPESTYEDTGEVKIGQYSIKNSDLLAHGTQTMTDVLKFSLNTGAIFAMRQAGPETFRDYVEKFGFGVLSGIPLEGESPGTIASLYKKGEIYPVTASFGQGIMVTPLQVATAFSALANGGKLMRPYIVDRVIDPSGIEIRTEPQEIRQVISPRTSVLISGMLVQVVQEGHAKRAAIPGYYVAGKTGTAQVANPSTGDYNSGKTIHTFGGFFPVSDPQLVVVARFDSPQTSQWAEGTAVPFFGEIGKFLASYYQIPPDAAQ